MTAMPPRYLSLLSALCYVTILVLGLTSCSSSTTAVTPTMPPITHLWGLPFKIGTPVSLGAYGLHGDNYHGLAGFTLGDADNATSALDIVPDEQSAPTEVIPLGVGKILGVDRRCHFVLVDHFEGVWVGYQHIDLNAQLKPGDLVVPTKAFAVTAAPVATSDCEHSDARHVHFAFLTGTGTTGTYVSMETKFVCGGTVKTSAPTPLALHGGAIEGLVDAPDQSFTVPDCSAPRPIPTVQPSPTPMPANFTGFANGRWVGEGTYNTGQPNFDMKLTVTVSGTHITGTLEEAIYSSTVAVSGTLSGSGDHTSITFTDYASVSGGRIILHCTYTATISQGRANGFWHLPGHTSPDGTITLRWFGP